LSDQLSRDCARFAAEACAGSLVRERGRPTIETGGCAGEATVQRRDAMMRG
jgi:hypothetical protein